MDLRIQKTKNKLKDAFISILAEKHFNDITVQEICEKSNIHRTTLYKHFKDKYDLLQYVLTTAKQDVCDTADFTKYDTPEEAFSHQVEMIVDYASMHHDKVRDIVNNMYHEPMFMMIINYAENNIRHALQSLYPNNPREHDDMLAKFMAGGMISTMMWWLNTPTKYSKADLVYHITHDTILPLLYNKRFL